MTLTQEILAHALGLGFDLAGIAPVGTPPHGEAFAAWLAAGYCGEMTYAAARAAERLDPGQWAPDARSVIMLAVNYDPGQEPAVENAAQPCETNLRCLDRGPEAPGAVADQAGGRIARYACARDYHEAIKPKLYALDAFIRGRTGRQTLGKVFVDSAPVLERDFAEQAGLGFIGRNTCLITPGLGSWTVLAGLMVAEVLDAGRWKLRVDGSLPEADHGCGRCTRCLDACPTHAFVAPHVLDARRCISYLTVELRGPIPRELRSLMGNWVFGCDACQESCPYNKQASVGQGPPSAAPLPHTSASGRARDMSDVSEQQVERDRLVVAQDQRSRSFSLSELLGLDEAGFRARFRGTPVMRARRRGLVRNACVAAGNTGDPALIPLLIPLLSDIEPLVRGHAAWALNRIGGADAERALSHALAVEPDPWVRSEIVS